MEPKYKIGDKVVEVNYAGLMEVVGVSRVEIEGETRDIRIGAKGITYWCKAIGWELPSWDDPSPCSELDLIPEEKKDDEQTK